jgi:ketosteroid isomerase-like protein
MVNFRRQGKLSLVVMIFCATLAGAQGVRKMTDSNTVQATAMARTMEVARRAFDQFRHGLAKGEWEPFLKMLADDFTFYFPTGKYQGQHVGKAKAAEFFKYVSETFSEGVTVTEVMRVTGNETTVVFEFKDEGKLRGQPYKNRVAVSFDVRGEQIVAYREYFGSDGKSN